MANWTNEKFCFHDLTFYRSIVYPKYETCSCYGPIFYSWDYYSHVVKSTIIVLYYIVLVDIYIKNSDKRFPLREI